MERVPQFYILYNDFIYSSLPRRLHWTFKHCSTKGSLYNKYNFIWLEVKQRNASLINLFNDLHSFSFILRDDP